MGNLWGSESLGRIHRLGMDCQAANKKIITIIKVATRLKTEWKKSTRKTKLRDAQLHT